MRSQTSTEYLIITAVVLIIGLIVVGVLGGIPGIGGSTDNSVGKFSLETESIGVVNYASSGVSSTFIIRNNEGGIVTAEQMWINGVTCAEGVLPKRLNIGEELSVECHNIRSLSSVPDVNVRWTSQQNTESTTGNDLGSFKGTTTVDCWGDQTNGYYDICTCDDLNLTRTEPTRDYALRYNIDFMDSHCSVYREGEGWDPIGNTSVGNYTGHFNGYEFVIDNLYINRPNHENVGLFGRTNLGTVLAEANFSNIGLTNVDVTGNTSVGGLVGQGSGSIYNSYVTGSVTGMDDDIGGLSGSFYFCNANGINSSYAWVDATGVDRVGGLVGDGTNCDVLNSYTLGDVQGSVEVGGLIGYTWTSTTVENSYVSADVRGVTEVGGLVGGFSSADIDNSNASGKVFCTGSEYCGGISGQGYNSVFGGTNIWINHTDDTASGCYGQSGTLAGTNASNCSP